MACTNFLSQFSRFGKGGGFIDKAITITELKNQSTFSFVIFATSTSYSCNGAKSSIITWILFGSATNTLPSSNTLLVVPRAFHSKTFLILFICERESWVVDDACTLFGTGCLFDSWRTGENQWSMVLSLMHWEDFPNAILFGMSTYVCPCASRFVQTRGECKLPLQTGKTYMLQYGVPGAHIAVASDLCILMHGFHQLAKFGLMHLGEGTSKSAIIAKWNCNSFCKNWTLHSAKFLQPSYDLAYNVQHDSILCKQTVQTEQNVFYCWDSLLAI